MLCHLRNIFRLVLNPPVVQEANTALRDASRPDWAALRHAAALRHGRQLRCDQEPQDLQRRKEAAIMIRKERNPT